VLYVETIVVRSRLISVCVKVVFWRYLDQCVSKSM